MDVKVLAREVMAPGFREPYTFHTRKGLRVGDLERRLRRLHPRYLDNYAHKGHIHYLLAESDRGTRLIAKVVDNEVVQLEAAPYEFC